MPRTQTPTAIDRFCSMWLDFHGSDAQGRPSDNFRLRYRQLGSLLTHSPTAAHLYYGMSKEDKASCALRLHEIYDGLDKAEKMIGKEWRR